MAQINNRFNILLAQKINRDNRKYTYEDISEVTGVSPTTLSAYSQGKVRRFDEVTLVALCKFFECELAELIEYPPDQSRQSTSAPIMLTAPIG